MALCKNAYLECLVLPKNPQPEPLYNQQHTGNGRAGGHGLSIMDTSSAGVDKLTKGKLAPVKTSLTKAAPSTTAPARDSGLSSPVGPCTPCQILDAAPKVIHTPMIHGNSSQGGYLQTVDPKLSAELLQWAVDLAALKTVDRHKLLEMYDSICSILGRVPDSAAAIAALGKAWSADKWAVCKQMCLELRQLLSLLESVKCFKSAAKATCSTRLFQMDMKLKEVTCAVSLVKLDFDHLQERSVQAGLTDWFEIVSPVVADFRSACTDLGHEYLATIIWQAANLRPRSRRCYIPLDLQQQRKQLCKKGLRFLQQLQEFVELDAGTAAALKDLQVVYQVYKQFC